MGKMKAIAAAKEEAGDTGDKLYVYRVRQIAGEHLISVPKECAGKVFARIVGKDGSITYLPVAPVKGEKIKE